MNIKEQVMKKGFISLLYWMLKDPENRTLQIMDKVDAHFGDKPDTFERQRWWVRHVLEDKDSPMHEFVMDLLKNTNPDVLVTFFVKFFFNASLWGTSSVKKRRKNTTATFPGPFCWIRLLPETCVVPVAGPLITVTNSTSVMRSWTALSSRGRN